MCVFIVSGYVQLIPGTFSGAGSAAPPTLMRGSLHPLNVC